MQRPRRGLDRPAFTLIELLIVIAIVALLIAVLLPALGAARNQSKASLCLSNLHELGLAFRLYGDENRDAVASLIETQGRYVHWIELLEPYVKSAGICRCVMDESTNWEPDPFHPRQGLRTTSFVTNHRITPDLEIGRFGQVRTAARTILLAESKDEEIGDHFHSESWALFLSVPEDEIAMRRHAEQSNYWFLDGHVLRLAFPKTWDAALDIDLYDPRR